MVSPTHFEHASFVSFALLPFSFILLPAMVYWPELVEAYVPAVILNQQVSINVHMPKVQHCILECLAHLI